MHKYLSFILPMLIAIQGYGQIEPSTTDFDFGELYSKSTTYTDITFKNTSGKTQFLLTIDKPRDVYYIFSSKMIQPDSSVVIRFKINEKKRGRFNYKVNVYFSDPREPFEITLKGNVKETPSNYNSMTACPDFNKAPPTRYSTEFDVVVRIIDSITREPIKNSTVYLVENGELVGKYSTNFKGVIKERIPIGYYYITAQKPPYNSNFHEGYLNFKRNYVEIELQKDPEPEIEEEVIEDPPEETVEEKPEEVEEEVVEEEEVIEITIEEEPEEEIVEKPKEVEEEPIEEEFVEEPVKEVEPATLNELPDTVFNQNYFKYNNITFILDVSSSMNNMGKMSLMKMSMIELTKILRPHDQVSMIKYSSEVENLLVGEPGDHKEKIINTVKGLKNSGMTAGGDAIKQAYNLNRKTYIEGGNNIVIMITDGVFNKGDKDYLNTIKEYYNSKGIIFTVVGIKTSDFITKHMINIVNHGGGKFVRILNVEDAQNKLIEEIKRTSFKF